jgi:hypothetical protein
MSSTLRLSTSLRLTTTACAEAGLQAVDEVADDGQDEEEDDDDDRDDNVARHGCVVCVGSLVLWRWRWRFLVETLESVVTARIGGLCGSCVFSLSGVFGRVELVS